MKHFKRNFLMTAALAFVLSGFVFGGNFAAAASGHTYTFKDYYMNATHVVTSNKSDSTINIACSGDSHGIIYFLYSVDGGDVQNFSYPSSSTKGCTEQLNKFKGGLTNAGFKVSTTLKVKYDSNGYVITDADSYKPSVPSTYSTSNPNGATILNDCWSKAQSDNDGSGIKCILNTVVDIMTVGVGILGVLGIIIVGIQYLTAADNEAQTTKAKRRLFEIVIGLVAYVLIYAILKWLLPNF